jgi:hypothetical protein
MSARWVVALALAAVCAAAQAAPFSVPQLMAMLARNTQGTASFVETRHLAVLDAPLESSGELVFVAPAHLEKRTLKPKPETLVLDNGTLIVETRRRRHVLNLADYPEVAGMVDSIRATLAGDRAALERVYHLALRGEADAWTLRLVPTDAKLGGVVASIRIEGVRDELRLVEILQADGDRSVMRIVTTSKP